MRAPADYRLPLLIAFVVLAVGGCSSGSSGNVVKGSVTLDGQPLAEGLINFITVDRSSPMVEGKIVDGRYEAVVPEGEKRVEISAPKVTGRKKAYDTPDSPMVDVIAELLPVRYNAQSELKYTVVPGEQEKSFELKGR